MALMRSWMSDALRAGLAGLALPVALLAVLAVLALGGAFGGLSSLGQLVVGPRVPLPAALPPTPASHATGAAGLALPPIPVLPARRTSPGSTAPRAVHNPAPAVGRPRGPAALRPPDLGIGHRRPTLRPQTTPAPTPAPHNSPPPSKPPSNGVPAPVIPPPPPLQPNPGQQVIQQVQQAATDVIGTVTQITSPAASKPAP